MIDTKTHPIFPKKHPFGFFSCCSIRLNQIVFFSNKNKNIPQNLDSSNLFEIYKNDSNKNKDITFTFFKNYNEVNDCEYFFPIDYHHTYQFNEYSKLQYKNIIPLIKKYFTPSININKKILMLKNKYNIVPENTLTVYYRGTDKKTETILSSFNDFYNQMLKVLDKDKNIKIVIQTDTAQFLDFINKKKLNNILVINENKTTYLDKGIHTLKKKNNYEDIHFFLSTIILLSKSKYIICNSCNCSIWMMFFREHGKNIIQYLNGKWYNSIS